MTNVVHKIICAIIVGPYLVVLALMCLAMFIGPILIAITLVITGCIALFFQRINAYVALYRWRIRRWWWFKKKNFQ